VTSVETERLVLRRFREDDLDAMAAIWSDPEVMRHIGEGQTRDRAASEALLARLGRHWDEHGFGMWAVVPRGSDEPVGWAGLAVPTFLPAVLPAVEVGWLLARSAWGQGYATEAAAAATAYGFGELGLDRLISLVYVDNTPSAAVAERLGMTRYEHVVHPVTGRTIQVFERLAPTSRS
jgi:RimJ/RimL family protein N-acetyltransferase